MGVIGQQPVDHVVGGDAFALGGEVEHQPVPQHGLGQGLDVVGRDVGPAVQQGPGLGAQDQVLHRPRARPPSSATRGRTRARPARRPASAAPAPACSGSRDRSPAPRAPAAASSRISSAVSTGSIASIMVAGRAAGDLELLLEVRIAHEDLEHEAVLLGLGQRIGALPARSGSAWPARRTDRTACAASRPTVTCRSCIASSRAACVLGGVRLISSARITLANSGPSRKRNSRLPVDCGSPR